MRGWLRAVAQKEFVGIGRSKKYKVLFCNVLRKFPYVVANKA